MKSKLIKYEHEQYKIVIKLATMLQLNIKSEHVLYDLDQDVLLQNNIMSLVPEIKKYYNCNNLKAVTNPTRIKRPWLSIIKTLLKSHYNIIIRDYHFTLQGKDKKYIHTQKYTFVEYSDAIEILIEQTNDEKYTLAK